jgi:hypothetical protein
MTAYIVQLWTLYKDKKIIRRCWQDNITMDLNEIWCERKDCINLAQDKSGLYKKVGTFEQLS